MLTVEDFYSSFTYFTVQTQINYIKIQVGSDSSSYILKLKIGDLSKSFVKQNCKCIYECLKGSFYLRRPKVKPLFLAEDTVYYQQVAVTHKAAHGSTLNISK